MINKDLVEHFDIPYETHHKALNILAFNGEITSSGGKHFTNPLLLELGNNGHRTSISCEVTGAGTCDHIIPFRWWHKEHPMSRVAGKVTYDTGLGRMLEWFNRWRILSRKACSEM